MPKRRFHPETIMGALRHADVLLAQSRQIAEVARAVTITEGTCC